MGLMKRTSCSKWIYGLSGILVFLAGCNNLNEKVLQSEIDNITARLVPDQRMTLCRPLIKERNNTYILSGITTLPSAKSEIIKTLSKHGINLIDSLLILPDTVRNKKYMGLVSLSVINLRKNPDHAAELVSQAIMGTPVLILEKVDTWFLIQTPDKYIAWTTEASISPMGSEDMKKWRESDRIIYLQNNGWIHSAASFDSQVVGDLVGGSILEKTGDSKNFIAVSTPDGRSGFIEKQGIMNFRDWENNIRCSEENICNVASTFMGLPYLWGGSSSKGVDCSGLVQSVFFRNGYILQRDASLQAQHGLSIDISEGYNNLKNGDLLFFGTRENNIPRVTHVGIYIGNGEYINSSGMVRINSLDSAQTNFRNYNMNRLLSAKRIAGEGNDVGIVSVNKHPWY